MLNRFHKGFIGLVLITLFFSSINRFPLESNNLDGIIWSQSEVDSVVDVDGEEELRELAEIGAGTEDNPYVIISNIGDINISNTNLYLLLRYIQGDINLENTSNIVIDNCISGNIRVINSKDIEILKSSINADFYGVEIQNSSNIKVENCIIFRSLKAGILLSNCKNIQILSNTIENSTKSALEITGSSDSMIFNNKFSFNKGWGIILGSLLHPSNNNTIMNNIFNNNEAGCVLIGVLSLSNKFQGNECTHFFGYVDLTIISLGIIAAIGIMLIITLYNLILKRKKQKEVDEFFKNKLDQGSKPKTKKTDEFQK